MEAKNNNKVQSSVIIVGVIGLVLGFFLGWLIGKGNDVPQTQVAGNDSVEMEESNDTSSTNEDVTTGDIRNSLQENQAVVTSTLSVNTNDAEFEASDQTAGGSVMVTGVSATKVTWVTVRENNAGKLGNILGARRIEAGNNQNVEVVLLRPTQAGKEYFVVLFEDNGDKVFNHKTDMQVVKDGDVLAASFMAK